MRSKADLLNQLEIMRGYVDKNFMEISEAKAAQALEKLKECWACLERRKDRLK